MSVLISWNMVVSLWIVFLTETGTAQGNLRLAPGDTAAGGSGRQPDFLAFASLGNTG